MTKSRRFCFAIVFTSSVLSRGTFTLTSKACNLPPLVFLATDSSANGRKIVDVQGCWRHCFRHLVVSPFQDVHVSKDVFVRPVAFIPLPNTSQKFVELSL